MLKAKLFMYSCFRSNDGSKQEGNMKSNLDNGVPIYAPVSRSVTNDANILNPNELYPLNSQKYKYKVNNPSIASVSKSGTSASEQKLQSDIQTSVNKSNMDSRTGSSLINKFLAQSSYSQNMHLSNNFQPTNMISTTSNMLEPYSDSYINKRSSNSRKPPKTYNTCSSSGTLKDRLSAAENRSCSLSYNSDSSKLLSSYCSILPSSCSRDITADMGNPMSGEGPLRVQYQPQFSQSVHSRVSSRVESWSAENNNLIFNNNINQLVNSNQNINHFHVSMLLSFMNILTNNFLQSFSRFLHSQLNTYVN